MDLSTMIESRRFVGREFLLWLWFESEVFEATLHAKDHGSFGFWVEKRMTFSSGRESTAIKGSTPGAHREAKEALCRGKLPESMGFHLSRDDGEASFVLKGETLGITSLALPTVLDDEEVEEPIAAPARKPKKRREADPEREAEAAADIAAESFYERMRLTQSIEALVETLYRDFLALRLGAAWERDVAPRILAWARGEDVDGDDYRRARDKVIGTSRAG